MKMMAIGLTQHRAPTRRQNAVVVFAQVVQHTLLNVAETLFAFAVKEFSNGTTQSLLNDAVRVQKGQAKATPHLSADGRFARSWKANKNNEQK